MKQVEVAVIGTGWCGGIRSETLSRSALVDKLHVCDIRPDRLKEVQELTRLEQASAFLALLELRRAGELSIEQAAPFAPIRVSRLQENNTEDERTAQWTVRSA